EALSSIALAMGSGMEHLVGNAEYLVGFKTSSWTFAVGGFVTHYGWALEGVAAGLPVAGELE
ncbi:hypothetical protein, partial [Klebsiella aerogenes]|uniref:hypothetical protein n=1 Tax=Klebsiella aerogenes TaxID=548 RepID=UPI001954DBAA